MEGTVKPQGGRWLAQGDVKVVEGAWPGSVVLIEFPSMADAENWYRSPQYQKILHLRVNNAISDLIRARRSSRVHRRRFRERGSGGD